MPVISSQLWYLKELLFMHMVCRVTLLMNDTVVETLVVWW